MNTEINYTSISMFNPPPNKSILIPVEGFEISFPKSKPNWWWRMWQFILLGWKWKDIK